MSPTSYLAALPRDDNWHNAYSRVRARKSQVVMTTNYLATVNNAEASPKCLASALFTVSLSVEYDKIMGRVVSGHHSFRSSKEVF